LGFTSRKPGKIVKLLKSAFELEKPVVIYESPYRIVKFLKLVKDNFENPITCVLAREITKTFEEYLSGSLEEIIKNLESRKKILGEFVVILDARSSKQKEEEDEEFNYK
jgi:16S rRNA (cytidine1402-2'-O)-methyltransferase